LIAIVLLAAVYVVVSVFFLTVVAVQLKPGTAYCP
jgi:hypothetical protein